MTKDTSTAIVPYRAAIDDGLRAYMVRVYNYMAGGLALTGGVAYGVSRSEAAVQLLLGTPLFWVALLAPIGLLIYLSVKLDTMRADVARVLFGVYAAMVGLSLAVVFLAYTEATIARTFFATASVFAAMSLYGYTTKRDLSGVGTFLFMGLFGIIGAMAVNLYLQSAMFEFLTSAVAVVIFTGLTAWDTQVIKNLYLEADGADEREKMAVFGALTLYLDFVNLFLHLLGDGE
jgi:hypothetical protein